MSSKFNYNLWIFHGPWTRGGGLDEVGLTQATFLVYLSAIAVIQYLVKIKQEEKWIIRAERDDHGKRMLDRRRRQSGCQKQK